MHAFLLVGNNNELIEKEIDARILSWKISKWDTIRMEGEGTIGIDAVRDFEHELQLTPRASPAKAGVVTNMDRMTIEAQNALLKTLEEPPPHTYIIGTTRFPEALLPTVRSRMSVIRLTDTPDEVDPLSRTLIHKLIRESPGKRLTLIDPYTTTRDEAKKLVSDLLSAAHQEMLAHPTPALTTLIRNLLEAESQLAVNVNQRLVVDNALLL